MTDRQLSILLSTIADSLAYRIEEVESNLPEELRVVEQGILGHPVSRYEALTPLHDLLEELRENINDLLPN